MYLHFIFSIELIYLQVEWFKTKQEYHSFGNRTVTCLYRPKYFLFHFQLNRKYRLDWILIKSLYGKNIFIESICQVLEENEVLRIGQKEKNPRNKYF